jgi:hypothetical protein
MNTEIQRYQVGNPLTVAEHFAKSGLFEDAKDMSKALVKILAGRELGLPDMASMTGIHIIKGKPVLGATLIASLVKGSRKYDFRVIELNEKKASIDFFQNKEKIGNSTFTIEDATKAGTQNLQKFPKNMLYARAISNGAKWYCPDVFNGQVVYSEGELEEVQISNPPLLTAQNDEVGPWNQETKDKFISREQVVRLFAIAKGTKKEPRVLPAWEDEQIKDYLATFFNIDSTSKILETDYEMICEFLGTHAGQWSGAEVELEAI